MLNECFLLLDEPGSGADPPAETSPVEGQVVSQHFVSCNICHTGWLNVKSCITVPFI